MLLFAVESRCARTSTCSDNRHIATVQRGIRLGLVNMKRLARSNASRRTVSPRSIGVEPQCFQPSTAYPRRCASGLEVPLALRDLGAGAAGPAAIRASRVTRCSHGTRLAVPIGDLSTGCWRRDPDPRPQMLSPAFLPSGIIPPWSLRSRETPVSTRSGSVNGGRRSKEFARQFPPLLPMYSTRAEPPGARARRRSQLTSTASSASASAT